MKNIFKFSDFKFSKQPKFENPSLIVGWKEDVGELSPKVIDYLNKKLRAKSFCEIEPAGFFSLGGIAIENNTAQFPESKFYCGERKDLVIFKSSEPHFERYRFLNAVLDVAEQYCKVKELFTISGTISPTAHTGQRQILAVFNQQEMQKELRGYELEDMDWEGPPPISSYFLWLAKKRGIPGASLWPEIPFYLAASQDPQAIKLTLSFLNKRFNLNLDLRELDKEIKDQNIKIDQLRKENPEINKCLGLLESELSLSPEEQMELTKEVTELLEKKG